MTQVFKRLNHPRFDQPGNDMANPKFGTRLLAVRPPTNMLDPLLGGDTSPRMIQIKAQFVF